MSVDRIYLLSLYPLTVMLVESDAMNKKVESKFRVRRDPVSQSSRKLLF